MQWDYRPKLAPDHSYQINDNNSNCFNADNCPDVEPAANYCKVIFKITIVFLSFAGFLYQATDICAHYFSYRTVVYTNTEQESIIDLPSVTFCLPTYFTKETLISLYGSHITRSMEEANKFNETLLPAIEPLIYESFQRQAFKDLNTAELLNNSVKSYNTIECRLFYPPLNWLNLTHHRLYEIVQYGIPCEEVAEIIESINANGKCFTFFSQLLADSETNSFKISVNRGYRFHSGRFMRLQIQFNREEYSAISDGQQRECIQVHPPFKIPSEACLHSINPGMSYDLVLTKTKAILQPPPYQTDCYSYHNNPESESMSRSDCIDKCMLRVYENKCQCLPIHVTIWKNNANLNLSICNYDDFDSISQCLEQELSNTCYDSCKPDCIDRHYHLQVESRAYPSDQQLSRAMGSEHERLSNMRKSAATINIWSNYLSDVTYVHTPAMSLIQLVCYLGGLAGLWLGVSVMTVSGWLAQLYPFVQKWNGKQKHLFLHCKRHLQVGSVKLHPEVFDCHQDDLLLFHRPSICSISQFNPKF